MGVPAFFRWITERYPKVLLDVIEAKAVAEGLPLDLTRPNPNDIEFDALYVDMNGIIHPCSHPEDRPPPRNEAEMFRNVGYYVDRLFAAVRPRKLLFLAIDGVAPRAKMNQQRARRFKSVKEMRESAEAMEEVRQEMMSMGLKVPPKAKEGWDSNVITPGTEFMAHLADFLRFYVLERCNREPAWRQVKVVFSDANEPGEGEHKIMNFIRAQRSLEGYDPNMRHVIHGLDADLIMLALATHEADFTILREQVLFGRQKREAAEKAQKAKQAGYDLLQGLDPCAGLPHADLLTMKPLQMLRVPVLREYLRIEFQGLAVPGFLPFPYDFERIVDDFVFMCFFVGNDFLPHLPSLDIRDGAIIFLFDTYRRLLPAIGDYLTSEGGRVNLRGVDVILAEVGKVEDELFRRKHAQEQGIRRREETRKAVKRAGGAEGAHAKQHLLQNNLIAPVGGRHVGLGWGNGPRALDMARPRQPPPPPPPPGRPPPPKPAGPAEASAEANGSAADRLRLLLRKRKLELSADAGAGATDGTEGEVNGATGGDGIRAGEERAEGLAVGSSDKSGAAVKAEATVKPEAGVKEEATAEAEGEGQRPTGVGASATPGSAAFTGSVGATEPAPKKLKAEDDRAERIPLSREMDGDDTAADTEGKRSNGDMDSETPGEGEAAPETSSGFVGDVEAMEEEGDGDSESEESAMLVPKDLELQLTVSEDGAEMTMAVAMIKNRLEDRQKQKLADLTTKVAENDNVRLHEAGWRDRYYMDKYHEDPEIARPAGPGRMRIFKAYVEGLCWVMAYYYQGCASWSWYYPFHYAPFASDLTNIEQFGPITFSLGTPFPPLAQLMAVLPPQSAGALPVPLRELMTDENSPLQDMYPLDVKTDPNGKAMPWLHVVLLPFIDETRLVEAMGEMGGTDRNGASGPLAELSLEERRRNTHDLSALYLHGDQSLSQALQREIELAPEPYASFAKGLYLEAAEKRPDSGGLGWLDPTDRDVGSDSFGGRVFRLPEDGPRRAPEVGGYIAAPEKPPGVFADLEWNDVTVVGYLTPAPAGAHRSALLVGAAEGEATLTMADTRLRTPRLGRGQNMADLAKSMLQRQQATARPGPSATAFGSFAPPAHHGFPGLGRAAMAMAMSGVPPPPPPPPRPQWGTGYPSGMQGNPRLWGDQGAAPAGSREWGSMQPRQRNRAPQGHPGRPGMPVAGGQGYGMAPHQGFGMAPQGYGMAGQGFAQAPPPPGRPGFAFAHPSAQGFGGYAAPMPPRGPPPRPPPTRSTLLERLKQTLSERRT